MPSSKTSFLPHFGIFGFGTSHPRFGVRRDGPRNPPHDFRVRRPIFCRILLGPPVVRRPAPAREAFLRPETHSRAPPPSNDATTNASFDARDLWRPPIHKVPADSTNSSLSMSCKTVHSTMRTAGRPHVVRMLTFAVCVADLATRGPTHRVGHFGSRRRREITKMGNFSTRRPSRGAISR